MEMPVSVLTTTNGGRNTNQKVIDWKDKSDRKWLTNHLIWAVHNGAIVELSGI